MDEKEIIAKAMSIMGRKSVVSQKEKYGKDYSKEMQRRSKTRLNKKEKVGVAKENK